jgi:transketolase
MRGKFVDLLYKEMEKDEKIVIIIGDVGFGFFDELIEQFPKRVINPGASEQLMMGMASGMAMEGYVPIVYSITPFILFRPFEFIRNYLNHEKIPVKIVGVGRDEDYGTLGFTHYASDDIIIENSFSNIKIFKPETEKDLDVNLFLSHKGPAYLNLKR